ncbi:hypothetical protein [Candidatus Nitrospira nitrosa]|nr:hypothetical protein [Candidatus Nitrospira nitrosa]
MSSQKNLSSTASGSAKSSCSNRSWSRVVSAFTLTVLASTFVACGSGLVAQEGPRLATDRTKITGQALLVGDQTEKADYGLYSYVLFESPPTTETKPVYLAVLLACVREFPDLGGLTQKYRPESLNAMYIPVTRNTTDSQMSPPEYPEQNRLRSQAEEILQRYNYDRAKAILAQLSRIQRNGGPYLLSSLKPVSTSSGANPFLFQDLAAVRLVASQEDQNKMAYEWVLDFVDRVSNPQSSAWNRTTLETFGDEIIDTRQTAFASYKVRADQLDLKKYIVFPMPDTQAKRTFPFLSRKTRVDDGSSNLNHAQGQSIFVPRRVSFSSYAGLIRQRGEACGEQCQVR